MTDKNANTEIRKEFCPNCEAETPCTHEAELYVCDICGEDFAKYIVSRNCNVSDVSMTRDVLTDIKTPLPIENTKHDYYKQELARLREERRWIPVSKPPKEGQRVFILAKSGGVSNTIYLNGNFMWDDGIEYKDGAIVAWFPIPQPQDGE